VRFWGGFRLSQYTAEHPALIASNDSGRLAHALKVMRSNALQLPAFDMPMLIETHAHVSSRTTWAPPRKKPRASDDGLLRRVLSLSARRIVARFQERSWTGIRGRYFLWNGDRPRD